MNQEVINVPDSILVKVCTKLNKSFIQSEEMLIVEKGKIPFHDLNQNFFFLKYSEQEPTIYWLMVDDKKYDNKFYCSVCNDFYVGGGSNIKLHLHTIKHQTACHPKKLTPIDAFILWFLKHDVPIYSLKDQFYPLFMGESITHDMVSKRLDQLYQMLVNEIRTILQRQQRIVLIADGWSDKRGRRYIGIAARFIEYNETRHIFLALADIPEVQHTANNIQKCINDVIHFYQIDYQKIVSLSSDSAPVMSKTAEIKGLQWDPCFIHLLNNCVRDFIAKHEDLKNLLTKGNVSRTKEVFISFLECNNAPISNISKYSKTRWMSCVQTIDSIVKLEEFIKKYQRKYNDKLFTEMDFTIARSILPYLSRLNEAYEFLLKQDDTVFSSVYFKALSTIVKLIYRIDEDNPLITFQMLKDMLIETFLNPDRKSCCRIMYSIILDQSHSIPNWFLESEEYQISINHLYDEILKVMQSENRKK
ncbi:hypothetical protein M9Y10_036525 [Tritrichomonas musculus]|uniref:BED-type domain-containing protein n=1 Tax=Tritrichomonas musculus TaxID=1915356 RepID=A0ABR2GVY0_9EUKA